jgi:hypothetical protein
MRVVVIGIGQGASCWPTSTSSKRSVVSRRAGRATRKSGSFQPSRPGASGGSTSSKHTSSGMPISTRSSSISITSLSSRVPSSSSTRPTTTG